MPLTYDEDEDTKKYLQQNFAPLTHGSSDFQSIPTQRLNVPKPVSPTPPIQAKPEMAPTQETELPGDDEEKIADSHPGHTSDDLSTYIKGQEAQIDKYGPDQEKQVLENVMKSQGSWGNRLARGAAAFAGPEYLKSLDDRESNQEKTALDAIPTLSKMNQENMGAKERYEGMSSKTPFGSSLTAPLEMFFRKVGIPEKDIPRLLANPAAAKTIVDPLTQLMSADDKIKVETMLKQLDLNMQNKKLASDIENRTSQQDLETKKLAAEAAEKRGKMGFLDKNILHRDEAKILEDQMKGGAAPAPIATTAINSKDMEAINWAKANRNDPRAKKILSMHGM